MRRGAAAAASVLLVAWLLASAGPAAGQEEEPAEPWGQEVQDPPMPGTPKQFRIAATAGSLLWSGREGRAAIDDRPLVGLDIERLVGPFLAFRVGGAYGRTRVAGEGGATDANQWLADVSAVLRLGFGPLRRAPVVPFGTVGIGTVVHDPTDRELATKSQSAAAFGAGVELDLSGPVGARAEWRRYVVDAENLFDPADRAGESRRADRLFASLYFRF